MKHRTAGRAGACAVGLLSIACSQGSGSGAFPADAGAVESGVDAHLEASSAADEGADGDAEGSDAAVLPGCDNGKTCALPLTCDETDLLCEPPCSATEPCSADTFCRQSAPGAVEGNCIGPDYQCLGNVPTAPVPGASYFEVVETYVDVSSGAAVPAVGLNVKVCAATDEPCASPANFGTTGPSGAVTLTVPAGADGFDGYFDVTGPSGDGGTILETLVFSSQPVVADGPGPTTTVTTAAALQQTVGVLGALDATRAQVMVVADACRSTPAFGASLAVSSADSATKVGYVGPNGIVPGASTFPVNAQALGDAVNVPGTMTTLTTSYGGQTVSTLGVVLRPDVLVLAYLTASPLPSQ
ncbi:MAG TPA: hypothetical protein VGL81_24885 [Polyangiaceae bacterium]